MADNTEIYLGNGQHTIYSDEQWYLVIAPGSAHPFLEGRFQTDAPDRTGYPAWTQTEFCISREGEVAVCRLPLARLPRAGEPNRFVRPGRRVAAGCGRMCQAATRSGG